MAEADRALGKYNVYAKTRSNKFTVFSYSHRTFKDAEKFAENNWINGRKEWCVGVSLKDALTHGIHKAVPADILVKYGYAPKGYSPIDIKELERRIKADAKAEREAIKSGNHPSIIPGTVGAGKSKRNPNVKKKPVRDRNVVISRVFKTEIDGTTAKVTLTIESSASPKDVVSCFETAYSNLQVYW